MKRFPGEHIVEFHLRLSGLGEDIARRQANLEVGIRSDIWTKILNEVSPQMRLDLNSDFGPNKMNDAINYIQRYSAVKGEKSKWHPKSLTEERKRYRDNAKRRMGQNNNKMRRMNTLEIKEAGEQTNSEPEDELQINNCYKCDDPNHLARYCPKNTKQTVQQKSKSDNRNKINNYERKSGNRGKSSFNNSLANNQENRRTMNQERGKGDRNNKKDDSRRAFKCRICVKKGHTYKYCTYFKRAKEILESMGKSRAANYLAIASEDPESTELENVKTYLRENIDWHDLDEQDSPERVINTILSSQDILTYGASGGMTTDGETDTEEIEDDINDSFNEEENIDDTASLTWDYQDQ